MQRIGSVLRRTAKGALVTQSKSKFVHSEQPSGFTVMKSKRSKG